MPVCRECFNFKTEEQERMKLMKSEVSEVTLRSATEEVGEDDDDEDAYKLIVSNQKSSENNTDSNIMMSAAANSSSDKSKTLSSAA